MAVVTKEQLENAAVDAQTLEDVVNGGVGDSPIVTRLGQNLKTMAKIQADLDIETTKARDWAISPTSPDGTTNKSAKSYSEDAAASALTAGSVSVPGVAELSSTTLGITEIFDNGNLWPDKNLLAAQTFLNGTTYSIGRINNRPSISFASNQSTYWQPLIADLNLNVGDTFSAMLMVDAKSGTTGSDFEFYVQQLDASDAVLATANPAVGLPNTAITIPTPQIIENITIVASCVKLKYFWRSKTGSTSTTSRFALIRGSKINGYTAPTHLNLPRPTSSPNFWTDSKFIDITKSMTIVNGGSGSNAKVNINGRDALQLSNGAIGYVNFTWAQLGVAIGEQFSVSAWIEGLTGGNGSVVVTQRVVSNGTSGSGSLSGAAVGTDVIAGPFTPTQALYPCPVPIEKQVARATSTGVTVYFRSFTGATLTISRVCVKKGPRADYSQPNENYSLAFNRPILLDRANAVVRYPDFTEFKNGLSARTVAISTAYNSGGASYVTLPVSTNATPNYHYFDVAACIAGTNPFVSTALPPLNTENIIPLGYSVNGNFTSSFNYDTTSEANFYNEVINPQLANLGAGVTFTGSATVTSVSSIANLTNLRINDALFLPIAGGAGNATAYIRHNITDTQPNTPYVLGCVVYCSDGTFNFSGAFGPTYNIWANNATITNQQVMTDYIVIDANTRIYYKTGIHTAATAGNRIDHVQFGVRVPTSRAYDCYVSGFFYSGQTDRIAHIDALNWEAAPYANRRLGVRVATLETQVAANTTALSTSTTAKLIMPESLFFVANRSMPIYEDNLFTLLNVPRNSLRTTLVSKNASGKPYARRLSGSIYVSPEELGTTANMIAQVVGTPTVQQQRALTIFSTAATKTSSPKIAFIGDSITNRGVQTKTKAKLIAAGCPAVTLLGTRLNSGMSGSDRGEGHEGWRWSDFTYERTEFTPVAVGGEAAFLAAPSTNTQNPFIRATVGGDNAAYVKNGYIFDYRFYLNRFSIPDPDIVFIALGTNDGRNEIGAGAIASLATNAAIMYAQVRAALPNARIFLVPPPYVTAVPDLINQSFVPMYQKMLELFGGRQAEKLYIMPLWVHQDQDATYLPLSSTTTDAQTGTISGTRFGFHPDDNGQEQWAECAFACTMNFIT